MMDMGLYDCCQVGYGDCQLYGLFTLWAVYLWAIHFGLYLMTLYLMDTDSLIPHHLIAQQHQQNLQQHRIQPDWNRRTQPQYQNSRLEQDTVLPPKPNVYYLIGPNTQHTSRTGTTTATSNQRTQQIDAQSLRCICTTNQGPTNLSSVRTARIRPLTVSSSRGHDPSVQTADGDGDAGIMAAYHSLSQSEQ